jgi:hypothetical protein
MWLMPQDNLHITALEITHSKTAEEIAALVSHIKPRVQDFVDYTFNNRARLIKPQIGFDSSALALGFLPAAGEALANDRCAEDDAYTYHHLRRDLWNLCDAAGVEVGSRYVVPSAHLTIGRFITHEGFQKGGSEDVVDAEKVRVLVRVIEETNQWLKETYWPKEDGSIAEGGEWIVGEGKGLDCRFGTLWYGGGTTLRLGRGF